MGVGAWDVLCRSHFTPSSNPSCVTLSFLHVWSTCFLRRTSLIVSRTLPMFCVGIVRILRRPILHPVLVRIGFLYVPVPRFTKIAHAPVRTPATYSHPDPHSVHFSPFERPCRHRPRQLSQTHQALRQIDVHGCKNTEFLEHCAFYPCCLQMIPETTKVTDSAVRALIEYKLLEMYPTVPDEWIQQATDASYKKLLCKHKKKCGPWGMKAKCCKKKRKCFNAG